MVQLVQGIELGKELASVLGSRLAFLSQCLGETFRGDRSATLGMGQGESPAAEEPLTVTLEKPLLMLMEGGGWKDRAPMQPLEIEGPPTLRSEEDFIELPPSPEEGEHFLKNPGPSADGGESSSPRPHPEPEVNIRELH